MSVRFDSFRPPIRESSKIKDPSKNNCLPKNKSITLSFTMEPHCNTCGHASSGCNGCTCCTVCFSFQSERLGLADEIEALNAHKQPTIG